MALRQEYCTSPSLRCQICGFVVTPTVELIFQLWTLLYGMQAHPDCPDLRPPFFLLSRSQNRIKPEKRMARWNNLHIIQRTAWFNIISLIQQIVNNQEFKLRNSLPELTLI